MSENKITNRMINMTGRRFSRLVVQSYFGKVCDKTAWVCKCDCGQVKNVIGTALRSGGTKSCGCLARQATSERSKTHGMRDTPEYAAWCSMKCRCARDAGYAGRGISVCKEWSDSFVVFIRDMGQRPDDSMSIDRIDNDGNYEPSNCRWASRTTQQNNRRSNRRLVIDGKSRTLAEWVAVSGTSRQQIRSRLRRGWQSKEAVFGR